MLKVNPAAGRIGSSINDLGEALDNYHHVTIKVYHSIYKKKPNHYEFFSSFTPEMYLPYLNTLENLKYDWLPSDFNDWEVIDGITGNY